jgi:short-chain fatty acids transporter
LVRIAIGFTAWPSDGSPMLSSSWRSWSSLRGDRRHALAAGGQPVFRQRLLELITLRCKWPWRSGCAVALRPAARLIRRLARPRGTGRGAVSSWRCQHPGALLNWGLSLIFGGLLVRALAERRELRMDYRAAAAAAYLGLGATWAMGLSSSAAQLQANPASLPKPLLAITGVIPFTETIFLWQSVVVTLTLLVVSVAIAIGSAPGKETAVTAEAMGIDLAKEDEIKVPPPRQPGEWLEHSPVLTVLLVLLAGGWLYYEFARQSWMIAISSLNTYNFAFIMAGLLLHWRPKRFLVAVAKSVPATAGVLIQFPFYGAIAFILTQAQNSAGVTVSDQIAHAFVAMSTQHLYPLVIGIYSAILGFFIPSGGGKWPLEAPYVMQAVNDLHVHLGWAVQVCNAAEALPNLINRSDAAAARVLGLRARTSWASPSCSSRAPAAGAFPAVGSVHPPISPAQIP